MKKLPKPTDEHGNIYKTIDVFDVCISNVRNVELKRRLNNIRSEVKAKALSYDRKAKNQRLYTKRAHDAVGEVSSKEMVNVYTRRMSAKGSRGRHIYNKILSAPLHRRCPLCDIGTANTLDHYLPKAAFPVLSVTPNNLIPCCEWCQRRKHEYFSTSKGGQTFHPYFDDFDDIWLGAQVEIGMPASFNYFVLKPDHWGIELKERADSHLRNLSLRELYSSNAGSRLAEVSYHLSLIHSRDGANGVRAHLLENLLSAEADHKNSWLCAMYRAAIESDWFCNGGFLVI